MCSGCDRGADHRYLRARRSGGGPLAVRSRKQMVAAHSLKALKQALSALGVSLIFAARSV